MSVRITCPACSAYYAVDSELRGQRIRCRDCGKPVSVPMPPPVDLAAEEAVVAQEAAPERRSPRRVREREEAPVASAKGGSCLAILLAVTAVAALGAVLIAVVGGTVAFVVWNDAPEQSTAPKTNIGPPPGLGPQPLDPNQGLPVVQLVKDSDVDLPGEVTKDISKDFAKETVKGQPAEAGAGGFQIDPLVLAKVKKATVYIRVTLTDGRVASGSGFFTGEPGLVVTNAHVIDMLEEGKAPPKKVEVVYQSGEPDSRTFVAKIIGVERSADLGLLRIQGDNLPEPLVVKNSADLIETQTVYVVGFPLGENLGKNITVNKTSISSLRKTPTGEMAQVQINGGMDHGNSGGPVVTVQGDVVGVSVAIIKGSQISFAVPGELVHLVLNGRLTTITAGGTYRDGDQVKMRIVVGKADPLGRLQKIRLAWWTGTAGNPRPPANDLPQALASDSPHQFVDMPITGNEARYELVMPTNLQPGQMLWLQPGVTTQKGQRWASALPYTPTLPAEKIPALLTMKPVWGARPLAVSSTTTMTVVQPGLKVDTDTAGFNALLTESMTSEDKDGVALRVRYQKYTTHWPTGALKANQGEQITRALPQIPSLHADQLVDWKNTVLTDNAEVTSSKTSPETKRVLTDLHNKLQRSMELLSITVPGRQCQFGESWAVIRHLEFPYLELQGTTANVTCSFRGVRQRDGRPEAVISILGSTQNVGGDVLKGKIKGLAFFDLTCFQVTQSNVTADMNFTTIVPGGGSVKVSVKVESKLERTLGKELLNQRGELAANDPTDAKQRHFKSYNVQLEAGKPCVVSLESFKGAGYFDTFLRVEDMKGQTVAQDDNRGVDLNSMTVFTPTQSGQYRIVATSAEPCTGNFLLVARQ